MKSTHTTPKSTQNPMQKSKKSMQNLMVGPSKNRDLSLDFATYCLNHPDLRFWQALRNWSGYYKIYGEYENKEVGDFVLWDTFYLKNKNNFDEE